MTTATQFFSHNLHRSEGPVPDLIKSLNSSLFSLACVQEPHYSYSKMSMLSGFKTFSVGGGRAGIVCSRNLTFWPITNMSTKDICVGLWTPTTRKPVLMVSVYLDGLGSIRQQITQLDKLTTYAEASNYDIMLAGDFNAHSRMWGEKVDDRGDALEEWITSTNLALHNMGSVPTWSNYRSKSVLDLLLTNMHLTEHITDWKITTTTSDHRLLAWKIPLTATPPMIRSIKKADWDLFLKITTPEYNFPEDFIPQTLDDERRYFVRDLENFFNRACPLQKATPSHEGPKWFNEECRASRSKVKNSEQKAKITNNEEDHAEYVKLRAQHTYLCRRTRRLGFREYMAGANSTQDAAKLMKIINSQKSKAISLLTDSQGKTTTPLETINNLMDVHFPKSRPPTEEDYEIPKGPAYKTADIVRGFKFCSSDIVRLAALEFGPLKAAGPDNIKPILIQKMGPGMMNRLTTIFKATLTLRYTPMAWRESTAILIPKTNKADYTKPKAYRPVALTSFLFKTLERVVLWELNNKHFKNNPLHRSSHAFQAGKSCDTALTEITDYIESGINRGEHVIAVSMDVAGAFDNVEHEDLAGFLLEEGMPEWFAE